MMKMREENMNVIRLNVESVASIDSLLWTGSYHMLAEKLVPITVKLTTNWLQLDRANHCESFHMNEIASCTVLSNDEIDRRPYSTRCLKTKDLSISENGAGLRLIIYSNSMNSENDVSGGKSRHHRQIIELLIDIHTDYGDNMNEAQLFQSKISSLIHTGHSNTKPVLIILNPKSGKGQAQREFENKIKPILDDCNVKYHLLITKHARHASEFIESNSDLANSYSALATVSGDGLLNEVLNGFVKMVENSEYKHIPIPLSIIPGGSGNGLAHSINSLYLNGNKSTNSLLDCTFHMIKGQPKKMDIVRITSPTKVYYSFLSFGWGLMSDVDIESERLRFLGEPRFTIWSIFRSFMLRTYPGELYYLPFDNQNGNKEPIPPLDTPITDKQWVVVKDKFVLVYAAYQKYLNSTCKFAPDAELDDQTIYLLYIREGVSFFQIIRFLLALEDGSHTEISYVQFIPVRAFRLLPANSNDIVTVDGEVIQCSPIQAEVVPGMASILLRNCS